VSVHGVRIAGLLCSDIVSPYLYRKFVQEQKPDLLINLANHFWFHGSRTLHSKTLQMARVHAVQNRLPMIVANNVAPSFALDPAGRVIAQSSWGARGVLYVELP